MFASFGVFSLPWCRSNGILWKIRVGPLSGGALGEDSLLELIIAVRNAFRQRWRHRIWVRDGERPRFQEGVGCQPGSSRLGMQQEPHACQGLGQGPGRLCWCLMGEGDHGGSPGRWQALHGCQGVCQGLCTCLLDGEG